MTLQELAAIVAASPLPDAAEVRVVGHGRLALVTHGYEDQTGGGVLLLYVEETEPGTESTPRADDPPGTGELPGDAASVAPAEEVAAGAAEGA